MQVGETDSFNTVKTHLQALDALLKTSKGYSLQTGDPVQPAIDFPTLTSMQERYQKHEGFRMLLQGIVIESYRDKLILVEETDYSPKDVPSGTPVEVENGH
jgi:hypothetical protein